MTSGPDTPGTPDPPGSPEFEDALERILNEGAPEIVADLPSKVLATKEGPTFLYADSEGHLDDRQELGLGFYHLDTRFLSHFRFWLSGRDPILLSSSAERAYMAHIDMTNPAIYDGDGKLAAAQQSLNVRRIRAVGDRLYEKTRIKNYNALAVEVDVSFTFGADFADIFEVRGVRRQRRGHYEPPKVEGSSISFSYLGEDDVQRTTRISFGAEPDRMEVRGDLVEATFGLSIPSGETRVLTLEVEPIVGPSRELPHRDYDSTIHELRRSYESWERESTRIRTDNALFNELLARGLRDLRALWMSADGGGTLAAGIPWYVSPFGRDALITSHQLLMVNPHLARDTLRLLASLQARERDDWRDAEPGKILHEMRRGELAGAGLIPHTPYYGSVDSTPWFLILLAQYHRWTADTELVGELMPAAEAALAWIDEHGDLDGDGFVEYRRRSDRGLENQGWKDSWNSVVHRDGTLARAPIALVEVQAYVYMAKVRMAELFAALGDHARAVALRDEATVLRKRFNDEFWMEDEGYMAEALDGEKRQVQAITSNPGHALYCDAVEPAKAEAIAQRLFAPDMFSGWGIRTLSKSERAYNPMSYHNGSVWPHDNALIAAGLKRYGFVEATNRVATAMFEAAIHMDYMRLPELFCGFVRRSPNRPVQYPVACSPQAWAAGTPFLLIQAMLGVSARAHENLLTINKPHLPRWLNEVELRNLRVGNSTLSLAFRREGEVTAFTLVSKEGNVRVVMEE